MRSAALGFALAFAVGLLALVAVGATRGSDLVYQLGPTPAGAVIELGPGARSCQAPIEVPGGAPFDRVAFTLGTHFRPGPPVRVVVLDDDSGERLGTGSLAGGYPDVGEAPRHVVPVGRIETDAPLRICLQNDGRRRVAVYGQFGVASPATGARVNGRPVDVDMAISLREEERSLLALLPDMAERASRFRAGWITPAVYAVLALLIVVAAPLLLARGIARAAQADAGE